MSDIKEQGFVKILLDGSTPTLHYIYQDDKVYSLTLSDSNKVGKLKENNSAKIILNKDFENQYEAKINIIDDEAEVKSVFDNMIDRNFTHFPAWEDGIVILEMNI